MKKILGLLMFISSLTFGQVNGNFNTVRFKVGNDTATFTPQPVGTVLLGTSGNFWHKVDTTGVGGASWIKFANGADLPTFSANRIALTNSSGTLSTSVNLTHSITGAAPSITLGTTTATAPKINFTMDDATGIARISINTSSGSNPKMELQFSNQNFGVYDYVNGVYGYRYMGNFGGAPGGSFPTNILVGGKTYLGNTASVPTAQLQIESLNSSAAGKAPIKINSGLFLATPEPGAVEYNGTFRLTGSGSNPVEIDGGNLNFNPSVAFAAITSSTDINLRPAAKVTMSHPGNAVTLDTDMGVTTADAVTIKSSGATNSTLIFNAVNTSTTAPNVTFTNTSSGVTVIRIIGIPTSSAGLSSGSVYSNLGVLTIVP